MQQIYPHAGILSGQLHCPCRDGGWEPAGQRPEIDPLRPEAQRSEIDGTVHGAEASTSTVLPPSPSGPASTSPAKPLPSRRMCTRSGTVNADLSAYQRAMHDVLGLTSFGYFSCSANGNCGFNAVSQLQYSQDRTVTSVLDLPPESQAQQAELRQATAHELRHNTVLQSSVNEQEAGILQLWGNVLQPARNADPQCPIWELLARAVLPAQGTCSARNHMSLRIVWHISHHCYICALVNVCSTQLCIVRLMLLKYLQQQHMSCWKSHASSQVCTSHVH